ncbi:hypothetical protein ACFQLX_23260 [Streptomyces polyrhachis]|uniref:Secreted protein n=1 Tax=Streptomyces polyrhachis TaxID=1282885 RepID=A0ABW2GQ36_9ACTN
MKTFFTRSLGAAALAAVLAAAGTGTAGAVVNSPADTAASPVVNPIPIGADDPVSDVLGKVLQATGMPGVVPNLGASSLGLPVPSTLLPWHGYCFKGVGMAKKFCLPVNGMY